MAFASGSADLVRGDTNQAVDVFVRDRSKGTTIRLPLPGGRPPPSGGQAYEPSISADGNVVAFTYQFTILRPNTDLPPVVSNLVLAWSRKTGKTTLVSVVPGNRNLAVVGAAATPIYSSREPSASGDGRYIAYTTDAPISSSDGNQRDDVYRYDRVKGTTVLVSVGFQGRTTSGQSIQPSISGDGSKVAFSSDGGDSLLPEDTGNGLQVYLRDIAAKTTERISGAPGGGQGGAPANGTSEAPSISADGRYVAFESTAGNLPGAVTQGGSQVYRRDRTTGQTVLVSVDSTGAPSPGGSGQAAISRDGRMVAFSSATSNLVAGIPGVRLAAVALQNSEVYIRDMTAGETALVSVSLSGGPGGARSWGRPSPAMGGSSPSTRTHRRWWPAPRSGRSTCT